MIRLLILGLLLTPAVAPQAGTGTIEGIVTADSMPIPNAVVTAQVGVNKGLQSSTDTSGHFSFRNIPDGNYRVRADAREGYAAPYKGENFKSVLVTNGSSGRAEPSPTFVDRNVKAQIIGTSCRCCRCCLAAMLILR